MLQFLFFLFVLYTAPTFANVRGSDLQNFNPTHSGLDFVTVHSSQTLQPLQLNVGAFMNYATNSLAYSTISSSNNSQKFSEPNDRLLYSNLHFGLGLFDWWDFGFGAGFINAQDIEQSNFLFSYGDTGINDIMATSKVRLFNEERWGFAFVLGADFEQIKNNPFAGDNPGPSLNFEGALDFKILKELLFAINLGYRLRLEGTPIPNTGVTPMPDQITYSTAAAYITDENGSAIIGEIYGSYPTQQYVLPTDRQLSNLEGNLSYRWRGLPDFDIHGGVGGGFYRGLGSPDIRVLIGFNLRYDFLQTSGPATTKPYSVYNRRESLPESPPDTDGDGVPDQIDQCPNTWPDSSVNEKGCATKKLPEKAVATDSDGDGVDDRDDRCPGTPKGTKANLFGCEIKMYNQ